MIDQPIAIPGPPAAPLAVVLPRRWWNTTLLPFLAITTLINLVCYFGVGFKIQATNDALRTLLLSQAKETAELKTALDAGAASAVAIAEVNRRAVEFAVETNRRAVEAAVLAAAQNQERIRETVQRDADLTQQKRDVSLAAVIAKVTELAQGVELSLATSSQIASTSKNAALVAAAAAREAAYASSHTANVVQSKVVTTADKRALDRQQAKAAALSKTLATRVDQYRDARQKLERQQR